MKKLLVSLCIVGMFFSALPTNATLYEFYREQGVDLPSVEARAPVYELVFKGEKYRGGYDQNEKYEDFLRTNGKSLVQDTFGAVKPFRPSGYSSTLASSLAEDGSETTLIVNSITLPDGTSLASTSFGDLLILTVGEGDSEEKIAVTDLNTSTLTFTIGTRGLEYGSYTERDANKHRHLPGERVYISDDDHFLNQQYVDIASDQTVTGRLTYSLSPIVPTPLSSNLTYAANVEYVNDIATSGASNISTTIKGIGEGATRAEMASGTILGGTNAPLLLLSEFATSTRDIATTSVLITDTSGYIDPSKIDQSDAWVRTGDTTLASTTFTGSSTYDILPEYDSDPIGGDEATRKSYVDSGDKYIFIPAGASSDLDAQIAYSTSLDFNALSYTNNQTAGANFSTQLPNNLTSVSSIKLLYIGENFGNLYLKFPTYYYDLTASSSVSSDTTDTDTAYAGVSSSALGIVTIPAAAYNAHTFAAQGLFSIRITRTGADGTDTYESDWDVIGLLIEYN